MLQLNEQGQVVNVITETEFVNREDITSRLAELDGKIADLQAMRQECENDLNAYDQLTAVPPAAPEPQPEVPSEPQPEAQPEAPAEQASEPQPEVAADPDPADPTSAPEAPVEQPVDAVQPQPTEIPVTDLSQGQ